MKKALTTLLAISGLLGACDDDGDDGYSGPDAGSSNDASIDARTTPGLDGSSDASADAAARTFTVTIENVAATRAFTSSGVFNTPVGAASPGAATPGNKYQFRVEAGRKQRLSFATMLAATNDLFFAPGGGGIALYDTDGAPISGDVTAQVKLWDLGTEINEEPGVGPNTVTNQPAANTGPDEHGPVVDIHDATDGVPFAYPAVADVLKVSVAYLSGTTFEITLENVSAPSGALHTSLGDRVAPISPGVWVVNNGVDPLFTAGMPDRGKGLEAIAEDGNPSALGAFAASMSGITYPASPGVWVVHGSGSKPLFSAGQADYGKGLEAIAEDGNPSTLGASLTSLAGVLAGGVFNMPLGASAPGPILPSATYQFSFSASPGASFSFASMLAATNDVFFAPRDEGIPLFDASGAPLTGDVSAQLSLWDDGSEVNERPGIGPNTVTNQKAPNTGVDEHGTVRLLSTVPDGFSYPAVSDVLKVSVSAN
jgi:hypothetical protein